MAEEEAKIKVGLNTTPFNEALKGVGQSLNKFGESFKETVHRNKKAWHDALHEMSDSAPGIASAFKIVLSPIAGAMIAAVSAFQYVTGKLEKMEEEFKKSSEIGARAIGNMTDAVEKAEKQAKEQNKAFTVWLDSHTHAGEAIVTQLERQLAVLKSQDRVLDSILAKEKERLLASVKSQVQGGTMTKDQGEKAEREINRGYEAVKGIGDYRTLQAEIDLRRKAAAALQKQQNEAAKQIARARFDQRGHQPAKIDEFTSEIGSLSKDEADYVAELDKVDSDISEDTNFNAPGLMIVGGLAPINPSKGSAFKLQDKRQAVQSKIAAVRRAIALTKARRKAEEDLQSSTADRLGRGQADYDRLGDALKTNAGAIDSDSMRQNELLSTMDPKVAQAAMRQDAWDRFKRDRGNLFRQFGYAFDPRRGTVDRFGQSPSGASGAEFYKGINALNAQYWQDMKSANQVTGKAQLDKLTEIHTILKTGIAVFGKED